ncbi:MAG: helix-turn-helix domain-containing protein [Ruminococcaceae bacterium]|nr:helix-turn-helix domain-containing protein [Oscillospiraceae bacterium]
MESKHYYYDITDASSGMACSRKSEDAPLIVNCFGRFYGNHRFSTNCMRKDYYLLILIEGSFDVNLNGKNEVIFPGTAIIFPPDEYYIYSKLQEENVYYLWVHFTGSYADTLIKDLGLPMNTVIKNVDCAHSVSAFENAFELTLKNSSFLDKELSVFINDLLIKTAKSLKLETGEKHIAKSLTLINESFSSDIAISELAKVENLSVSRYNYVFKKSMGVSPLKYITSLRINKAKYLLKNTDLKVSRIASECGYSDSHFFHRIFKNETEMTPGQYREN